MQYIGMQMYMKNYDKNKESSYIQYLDPKNLYGWEISQKLPVDIYINHYNCLGDMLIT